MNAPPAADSNSPADWSPALSALTQRLLGTLAERVEFCAWPKTPRSYAYEASGGRLMIGASDPIAAARGLHAYLGNECRLSFDWDGPRTLHLNALPEVGRTEERAQVDDVYYLNFCTFSYTMAYWDWDDWEREIDWMALHGVTMPLAVTGHEAVLHTVYTRLGLTDDETRNFLGGPGYLPFLYMGVLDNFGGPLSADWIERHRELGARILHRQRELGMTPVLPTFSGHVPRQIAPGRTSSRLWQGHETHVIDPDDALYSRIAEEITRTQIALWGAGNHFYAADPFIEMIPVDADPEYPGRVAVALLDGLTAADPNATWVLQAWPFSYHQHFWSADRVSRFLDAIPHRQLIILDLWAEFDPQWERLAGFAGKRWIWCALLNFGGRSEPAADLGGATPAIAAAQTSERPPHGIGLAMEATRNNPVYFERVLDHAWGTAQPLDDWLTGFVTRRYRSQRTAQLTSIWRRLTQTVYNSRDRRIFPEQFNGIIAKLPSFASFVLSDEVRRETDAALWYDPVPLIDAWDEMTTIATIDPELGDGRLEHDLIEVGMAVMSRVADRAYADLIDAIPQGVTATTEQQVSFLAVFDDLERLLSTRPEFGFAHWEEQATRWAGDESERRVLTDNARRMLTVWGSPADGYLDDYAARLWSGLVGYYRRRWALWLEQWPDALPGSAENEVRLQRDLVALSEEFLRNGAAAMAPVGSVAEESRRLVSRYRHTLDPGGVAQMPDAAAERAVRSTQESDQ